MKRLFSALLTLMLLLSFAVPALAEYEVVTIRYAMWDASIKDKEIEEIIKPFEEANPGIKVELTAIPWDEYWKKMQVGIAGGDTYDVFAMSVAYAWEFAHKGMVMNLQPLYEEIVAEHGEDYLYGNMLDVGRYPDPTGDLYAMPYGWVGSLLFYNKTMFDEAGLDYPTDDWSWDDLWDAAEKLVSGQGPAKKYGFRVWISHELLHAYINAAGGHVLNDEMTECLINQPEAVAALEELKNKIDAGICPTIASMEGQPDPFLTGKVGMTVGGSYAIESYREITDFEWDCVMVPYNAQTGKRVIYGGPDSLAISATTEHPEEAMKFLEYYCASGRSVESFMGGKASIVRAISEDEAWLEKGQLPENKAALLKSAEYLKGADFCYKWSEWYTSIIGNELNSAFNGDITMQEACDTAAKQVNAILAEVH